MDYEFEKWVTDVVEALVIDLEKLTRAISALKRRVEELENGKR